MQDVARTVPDWPRYIPAWVHFRDLCYRDADFICCCDYDADFICCDNMSKYP